LTPSNMIAIGMILLFLITLMWAAMRLSSNTE
jgi:flagellar biogenesis protein FliO